MLGDDHPDTLTSMKNLAGVLESQGRHEEAEKLYRETLDRRKDVLGDDHQDTLTSMNHLASVLESQGQVEAAQELRSDALERAKRTLGDDHPITAQLAKRAAKSE